MQFKLDLNKKKVEKLSVKAHSRRKKDAHEIDHAESEHAMAIQRSAYIAIDQDVSNKNLDQIANKLLFSKKSELAELKESVFFKQRKWNVLDAQLKETPTNPERKDTNLYAMDKQYAKAVDPSNLVSIRYSLVADVERRLKLMSYHKKKVLVKLSNMRVSG